MCIPLPNDNIIVEQEVDLDLGQCIPIIADKSCLTILSCLIQGAIMCLLLNVVYMIQ
jgi:hypothetical protein